MRIDANSVRQSLKVYFIMGSTNCHGDPIEVLSEALDGGITLFQFREKGQGALTGEANFKLAQKLQQLCHEHNIPFIVNDDIELAIALNADGVHIGQEDGPVKEIRERLGPHKIVGVSAHSVEEAEQAIQDGADYLGLGPIFPTRTKEDAKEVQGTRLIEDIRKHVINFPLVGIGGITLDNSAAVIAAGADGVAVISAIANAASPGYTAARFSKITCENSVNK